MIIQCESCSRKFTVKESDIPEEGRMVQCGYCSVTWHQMPISIPTKTVKHLNLTEPITETSEGLSIDKIKASDGKAYKFIGSRWVELLPSGKTGLFAKRKIEKELDQLTGRKEKNIVKKKQKKIREVEIDTIEKEIDPSSEEINKQPLDAYRPKRRLGFFGYIFLLIIIAFSIIGVIKTFENDLLNYFPEMEYVVELIDEQFEYVVETVKNMIVIFNDLIDSY